MTFLAVDGLDPGLTHQGILPQTVLPNPVSRGNRYPPQADTV
jgi:hypothetical protein